jgi:uncharacterized glyoxalase superfamily protein PhnB
MSNSNAVVWPNLGYRDARAAIRFLVAAFGFEEIAVYDAESKDAVGHAELRWPAGGGVTIHSAGPNNSIAAVMAKAGDEKSYPAFSVHISTDEPDALFARAVAAGAKVVREVEDTPYGTRGFVVQDPEGLYWSVGTPLPKLVRDSLGQWRPAVKKPSR